MPNKRTLLTVSTLAALACLTQACGDSTEEDLRQGLSSAPGSSRPSSRVDRDAGHAPIADPSPRCDVPVPPPPVPDVERCEPTRVPPPPEGYDVRICPPEGARCDQALPLWCLLPAPGKMAIMSCQRGSWTISAMDGELRCDRRDEGRGPVDGGAGQPYSGPAPRDAGAPRDGGRPTKPAPLCDPELPIPAPPAHYDMGPCPTVGDMCGNAAPIWCSIGTGVSMRQCNPSTNTWGYIQVNGRIPCDPPSAPTCHRVEIPPPPPNVVVVPCPPLGTGCAQAPGVLWCRMRDATPAILECNPMSRTWVAFAIQGEIRCEGAASTSGGGRR
jgi:hypothetical protein